MGFKFISFTHQEYFDLYNYYKDIVNNEKLHWLGQLAINSACMDWHKLGLAYYETNSRGKKFRVVDNEKWMQYLMLMKIANGR
jgi:hypothetical protein